MKFIFFLDIATRLAVNCFICICDLIIILKASIDVVQHRIASSDKFSFRNKQHHLTFFQDDASSNDWEKYELLFS